jgi:Bifunctional DNA primase/polymerase, N-terminal
MTISSIALDNVTTVWLPRQSHEGMMTVVPAKTMTNPLNTLRRLAENQRRIILEAARVYLERSWKPLPIPTRQKRPKETNLQLEAITLDNYQSKSQLWHGNIGVQFGGVSNGLCDVDLDCREARVLARYFLPQTNAVFARRSAPAAHWLYYSDFYKAATVAITPFDDPIRPTDKNAGEHGTRLLELHTGRIGAGGETVGAQVCVHRPFTRQVKRCVARRIAASLSAWSLATTPCHKSSRGATRSTS